MMAGHPNETSPLGLRNLPFTLHMGEKDAAYNRNKTASDWEKKLDDLQRNDPEGYTHLVKIHPGKGHWMDREDAVAIPWMAKMNRNPIPSRIVWKQDDVVENRFYWIAIQPKDIRDRAEITASRTNNIIEIQTKDADRVTIRLNEEMFDLEKPISIRCGSELVFDPPNLFQDWIRFHTKGLRSRSILHCPMPLASVRWYLGISAWKTTPISPRHPMHGLHW